MSCAMLDQLLGDGRLTDLDIYAQLRACVPRTVISQLRDELREVHP
jgi:hypothetical protein